jgi:hypothetical protein
MVNGIFREPVKPVLFAGSASANGQSCRWRAAVFFPNHLI